MKILNILKIICYVLLTAYLLFSVVVCLTGKTLESDFPLELLGVIAFIVFLGICFIFGVELVKNKKPIYIFFFPIAGALLALYVYFFPTVEVYAITNSNVVELLYGIGRVKVGDATIPYREGDNFVLNVTDQDKYLMAREYEVTEFTQLVYGKRPEYRLIGRAIDARITNDEKDSDEVVTVIKPNTYYDLGYNTEFYNFADLNKSIFKRPPTEYVVTVLFRKPDSFKIYYLDNQPREFIQNEGDEGVIDTQTPDLSSMEEDKDSKLKPAVKEGKGVKIEHIYGQ